MKIIGSDYDGTLTHRMGPHTFEAIRRWREAGNRFGIVSGRGVSFREDLRRDHPELELDFFVGFNGGAILDGEDRLIYEKRYSEVSPLGLTLQLLAWGSPCVHLNADRYYCVLNHRDNQPHWVSAETVRTPEELPDLSYFVQISTQYDTPEETERVVALMRVTYGELLNPLQNGTCLDIVPPSVDKEQGLLRVAEHFGVGREAVIAVGDNVNDAAMIAAFRSYAMASGVGSIKELADFTTESVAALIERELL